MRDQLRLRRVAQIVNGKAAISPGPVTAIAGRNHVMQGNPATGRQGWRFPGRSIHAWHPPAAHDLRLGNILQVDHAENMVGESVKMRGDRRVAPSCPPQSIDAEARHLQKCDLSHLSGPGNIVNAQAGAEFLAVGNAIGQRIFEIAANVVVGLHGDDIRAVGQQEEVTGNLQVMGSGKVSAGEEPDRLEFARIRAIQNRDSIAEHVADI